MYHFLYKVAYVVFLSYIFYIICCSCFISAHTIESSHNDAEFVAEQGLVTRLVHQIRSDTPDYQYQLLTCVRKHFGIGGEARIKYTLPPLVMLALQLAQQYSDLHEEVL